jgi:microcin C transport system substrate-binding protein
LPSGDAFRIEFLLEEPAFQAHHAPYIKNLGVLGIDASVRLVDPVQFRSRVDDFDFDVAIQRFSMSSTPGDAMRTFFSSQVADIKGSQNLSGIKNPAIDALIERIIAADNRDELRTACRAFDRVFRAGRYWVPQWYSASHRIAYWDVFAHPPNIPRYVNSVGAPDLWWFDEAKAKKPEQAKPDQTKSEQAK